MILAAKLIALWLMFDAAFVVAMLGRAEPEASSGETRPQ